MVEYHGNIERSLTLKSIHTLIPDIYTLVGTKSNWFTPEISLDLSQNIARRLSKQFNEEHSTCLRLSKMGPTCPKALWYSIHHPELAEPLPPWATIKYSYGHILEALVIALAKATGHTVLGEQDELVVDGIRGHRDCVIDGCLCDIKSSTTRSFIKFKDRSIKSSDTFGYLDQLDGYLVGSAEDPLVLDKEHGYLIAIDKQLGHMCLYEHHLREDSIRSRIRTYKQIVGGNEIPSCTCGVLPEGKSGNIKLDVKASYNSFKHVCFPRLRTFLYASGPVYLTHVERMPDVQEISQGRNSSFSGHSLPRVERPTAFN